MNKRKISSIVSIDLVFNELFLNFSGMRFD